MEGLLYLMPDFHLLFAIRKYVALSKAQRTKLAKLVSAFVYIKDT